MKKNKKLILPIFIVICVLVVGCVAFLLNHYIKIQKDFTRLQEEDYDTVFFSMYPVDNYAEEDYAYFRGMDIVKTSYNIANGKILRQYMDTAKASGNVVSTVYLGVDPERAAKEDVVIMVQESPEVAFEIILAYPQIEYWLEKSEKKCEEALQAYEEMAEWLTVLPNVRVYFFSGDEWLICNEANYEDTFQTNIEVSQFLMCNSDYLHYYQMTADTVESDIREMRELIAQYRTNRPEYANAADMDIVFLGDSIIGNYTNSMSVPEVVKALTGARVYNCGYGGKSAALAEKTPISLPDIVDAVIRGDATSLPEGEQVTAGVTQFLEREDIADRLMFVINYGLNDYYEGIPVRTEDAYDITTYSGAIRTALEKLQEAYPDAEILLMTPNFTTYYGCGTEVMSEVGSPLAEYADAVLTLSQELEVEVLDNFRELPITRENWMVYQDDGCHLNERGRFLLGSRIAGKIQK